MGQHNEIMVLMTINSKTCVKRPLSKGQKLVFETNYPLMQVKSTAECSKYSAILSTFIKLPIDIMIFVLSVYEWPFYIGFTVCVSHALNMYAQLFSEARFQNLH